ncbi:metal-dependent hydrolase [Mucilaginibacter sp. KACC 22063]|uniref:metal-dependent hydrolase n=1 Tax=Mucilaginibacter sp. KACC 22063 TaxID=3025666 RepID=UPI0023658BB8|nr:metal-dependent hydrolase [Mucilaginibacter sp. KACC 22063]WDF55509.1 metal-dependent hydrolase [Mucilaginibacter sp. KACC 22063]
MKATFYGQATIMLETGGKKLLFDPFITPNPQASHIDITSLKPDYILISHGHGDHIADVVAIQKDSGAKVICIAEISDWLGKQGIEAHGMNIGGGFNFDFGRVKMVNAIHSSALPDGSNGGNPAGFVIYSNEGKNVYFAGDTALTYDMKLLADDNIDWAILPIGDNYTMGVDDAIKAAGFVDCNNVIGVHYDTFPVIKIDKEEAREKFIKAGINIQLPGLGESVDL